MANYRIIEWPRWWENSKTVDYYIGEDNGSNTTILFPVNNLDVGESLLKTPDVIKSRADSLKSYGHTGTTPKADDKPIDPPKEKKEKKAEKPEKLMAESE